MYDVIFVRLMQSLSTIFRKLTDCNNGVAIDKAMK